MNTTSSAVSMGSDWLILGFIVLLFVVIVFMAVKMMRDKKLTPAQRAMKAEATSARRYKFLSSFFMTQGRIAYISSAISALSVYKSTQIHNIVVKLFAISTGLQIAIVCVGFFIFGDIFSIMACIIIALFVGHITVDREIEKINLKVYKEMGHLISSVRQEYLRSGSIPEALISITPTKLMARPVAQIEEILTSTNGEERLLKFYEASPFRMLQTFATVCFNINNTGDDRDEVTGQSRFLDSLSLMTSDINAEIQRLTLVWQKFNGLIYLPLVPLIGTPAAQAFLRSSMPGTAVIFDGMLGFICNFVTLLLTGLMFYLVASLSKSSAITDDDRMPFVVNLYDKYAGVRRFIKKVAPKNAARRAFIARQTEALSRKTPELFTLERILFFGAGLIVGAALLVVSLSAGRNYVLNSIQNMGIVKDTSLDRYPKEDVLAFDNEYLNRQGEWKDEYILDRVQDRFPELTSMDAGEYVKRLKDKEKALKATNLQWYYILFVYAFAVGISFIPNLLLALRKWSAKSAAEEDFLQLQSLMAIIMCMGVDTLDALEQLCTNTRIHRPMLLYAYHSYPAHPDKELDRLKSKVTLVEFKRFIDKLKLTTTDLSLAEAFSDLLLEREHMVRMREMSMLATIEKRRNLAGLMAKVPMGAMVALQMLVPIAYLGVKEFMGALGGLNGL